MKYGGYQGELLEIDLSSREIKALPLKESLIEEYVGGKGFGVKLYQDYISPDTEPLSKENALLFLTGPLTGTVAPAMRSCVVTRSPLTGGWLDSYFGGYFGQAIKYAGYDGIIITGRSEEPVYISIDGKDIQITIADQLVGKSTSKTREIIQAKMGQDFRVASIGPAGENLVKYSLISCENNRQAGRGGAGAVMGSKNLKALAVRGDKLIEVKDQAGFMEAVSQANKELASSEDVKNFREYGTPSSIPFAQEIGMLPTKNYQQGQFAQAENLTSKPQADLFWQRDLACSGCPIACGKIGRVFKGKYQGLITDTVEYETLGLLGSNLEIGNIQDITRAAILCDELGLDSISAGGAIGFLLEANQRGLYDAAELQEMDFGKGESLFALLEAAAHRQGETGEMLAEGVARMASLIPRGEEFAVHIKGLETPAWPPRGAPGMGLALMTADRGGCHQRAFPVLQEVGGVKWRGKKLKRLQIEDKAALVVEQQNELAALDTLIKCDFGTYGIENETYQKLLTTATGLDVTEKSWQSLGAKIWDEARRINIQHGFTTQDDLLPARFSEEPLPDGPAKGHKITREEQQIMLQEYYQLRGWDEKGRPPDC